jgi:hypothetical protein
MRWHQRLGHLNTDAIRKLANGAATRVEIEGGNEHLESDCLACIEGKQHKTPFKTGCTRATWVGELLHMDLAGPMETQSFDNKRYFIIIIDDYSRAIWTSPIASKLEVIPKVWEYIAQLENAFSVKVQSVMADNGTEFVNSEMNTYLKSKGIALFNSVPYTPEQNGIAEHGIQTLTEGARAMLFAAKLPKHLWSAAIKTMAYLRNRSPTRANNGVTPLNVLLGRSRIWPIFVCLDAQLMLQFWHKNGRSGIQGQRWVILLVMTCILLGI